MARFWLWSLRNPAVAVAAVATAWGVTGVVERSLAVEAVLALGIVAAYGNEIARRAACGEERRTAPAMVSVHESDQRADRAA